MARNSTTYLKRSKFALYLIMAALIPYFLRLAHYYINRTEIPTFYKSEWDLFVFCIAIAVAIIAENKNLKAPNHGYIIHIICIIIIPTFGLYESMGCEHQKIVFNNDIMTHFQSNNFDLKSIRQCLILNEDKKDMLFHISIIAAVFFVIDCFYMTVLKKSR